LLYCFMKRLIVSLVFILMISLSFVSAGFFDNTWMKLNGNVVDEGVDSDVGFFGSIGNWFKGLFGGDEVLMAPDEIIPIAPNYPTPLIFDTISEDIFKATAGVCQDDSDDLFYRDWLFIPDRYSQEFYTRGTITRQYDPAQTDNCLTEFILQEFSCYDPDGTSGALPGAGRLKVRCPNGCEAGICKGYPVVYRDDDVSFDEVCSELGDLDKHDLELGGDNLGLEGIPGTASGQFYVAGYVDSISEGDFSDRCEGDLLIEYFCYDNGNIGYVPVTCPTDYSCYEGACIETSLIPVMGNGIIEEGEDCDDGNTDDLDGCSSTGMIEEEWTCVDEPSICSEDCVPECGMNVCGDDGCGGSCGACAAEESCNVGVCEVIVIQEFGNGIIEVPELCDDGNTDDLDGCSSIGAIEQGYECLVAGEPCVLIVVEEETPEEEIIVEEEEIIEPPVTVCMSGDSSVPPRARIKEDGVLKYCDPFTMELVSTFGTTEDCIGDYECESNICVDVDGDGVATCSLLGEELEKREANLMRQFGCAISNILDYSNRNDEDETAENNDYLACVEAN
jgi:cysteine-rich repeat protein